ncbi:C40 family peptidase [Schwartzia sp. (in: firmicutes)]
MKHLKIFFMTAVILLTLTASAFAAPVLKKGSEGHDVRVVQQALQNAGYNISSIDGVFGNETYRALIAFQRDNKIKITGEVDRATWKKLKEIPSAAKSGSSDAPKGEPPKSKSSDKNSKPAPVPATPVPSKKGAESQPFLEKSNVDALIRTAKKYIGTKYRFGGTTPKGFDCSGFLQYVFKQHGYTLPRTADEQFKLGKNIKTQKELVPGDLVFFSTYEKGASHCGLYIGNGKFIHVSSSKGVRIDELSDRYYWKSHWYGGKHIVK